MNVREHEPGRILIVEDEPALLRGLKDTFASKGCEVLTAAIPL